MQYVLYNITMSQCENSDLDNNPERDRSQKILQLILAPNTDTTLAYDAAKLRHILETVSDGKVLYISDTMGLSLEEADIINQLMINGDTPSIACAKAMYYQWKKINFQMMKNWMMF